MKNRLFEKCIIGDLELKNRFVMAPLTRNRAGEGNIPVDMNVLYYKQRSSAGLIISEGSQVSPQGVGYVNTPGIYNDKQVQGWKKVTKAVHDNGGKIFLQLWHVGRISHPDFHGGKLPVAPSPVKPDGKINTYNGIKDMVAPRELEYNDIIDILANFSTGAANAREAGFDGVEIHGANCYLPHQFLCDGTNKRFDIYGGTIANRSRFLFQIIDSICDVWGSERVGLKLSPSNTRFGTYDSNPVAVMDYVIEGLNDYGLAYLHLGEPLGNLDTLPANYLKRVTPHYRKIYKGTLITNGGYTPETAEKVLNDGDADLVAFGRAFIANPDLPERVKQGADLNEADPATFYEGGEKGYVDYPTLKI